MCVTLSESSVRGTDQQLKEEPGIFVCVLSADTSADDHLQGQLLVELLQETKQTRLICIYVYGNRYECILDANTGPSLTGEKKPKQLWEELTVSHCHLVVAQISQN